MRTIAARLITLKHSGKCKPIIKLCGDMLQTTQVVSGTKKSEESDPDKSPWTVVAAASTRVEGRAGSSCTEEAAVA